MKIESKYKIGDCVHILFLGAHFTGVIHDIKQKKGKIKYVFKYICRNGNWTDLGYKRIKRKESKVFSTKEELFGYLRNEEKQNDVGDSSTKNNNTFIIRLDETPLYKLGKLEWTDETKTQVKFVEHNT